MDHQVVLFCIPHAGGGASAYRRWAEAMAPLVSVKVLQLPGRESRFSEPPLMHFDDALADLYAVVKQYRARQLAFIGHSLGGLFAFELAHMLRRHSGCEPDHLFISACRAPHLRQIGEPFSNLPRADFVSELTRRYGGIPAAILTDNDYMSAILPAFRADFGLLERYCLAERSPLTCPISAFGGRDDTIIPAAGLQGWGLHTTGAFRLDTFEGDHFYLQTQRVTLTQHILSSLKALPGANE